MILTTHKMPSGSGIWLEEDLVEEAGEEDQGDVEAEEDLVEEVEEGDVHYRILNLKMNLMLKIWLRKISLTYRCDKEEEEEEAEVVDVEEAEVVDVEVDLDLC